MTATRTTTPSLFERLDEIQALAGMIEIMDSEETNPDQAKAMEEEILAAIATTQAHVDRTAAVLAAMEASELYASQEARRLQERESRIRRHRQRLEQYCLAVLESKGIKKLDGFTSTLASRANPPAVIIAADAQLPAQFLREAKPVEPSADKSAIKAALQRGEFVPGCRIAQTVRLVRT